MECIKYVGEYIPLFSILFHCQVGSLVLMHYSRMIHLVSFLPCVGQEDAFPVRGTFSSNLSNQLCGEIKKLTVLVNPRKFAFKKRWISKVG